MDTCAAILGVRQVNRAIALIAADDGGCGVFVVVTAVTPADFVIGRDLMIQLDVELPTRIGANDDLAPVGLRKARTLYVGERIQIQNRLADRVDSVCRDNVVHPTNRKSVPWICWTRRGSLVSSARIVDSGGVCWTLREVSGAFRRSGYDSLKVDGVLLTNLFQIDKEESLIPLQRTAESEAILIPYVVGLFAGVEEVAGIKVGPLPVPPATAVKVVRPLL